MSIGRTTISLCAGLLLAAPAQAAQTYAIDVRPGSLGDAVITLGRQTGISIGFSDGTLSRRQVKGVRGRLTVQEALRRLLAPAGARAVFLAPGTVRVVAAPAPLAPRPRPVNHRPPPPKQLAHANAEQEIVVVGSLRRVREMQYPGSVQVLGGDDPAFQTGVPGSEALVSRAVTLSSTHLGSGRNKLFIRGVADSSFNGVTQATVGQYFGSSRLNYNSPDPDLRLFDLERVELLSGPQGTLYGAGSLGGVVRVVPSPPDLHDAAAIVAVGASGTEHGEPGHDASAVVNVPISRSRAALRIVAYGKREGGYIDDVGRSVSDVNRVSIAGGRATMRTQFDNGWRADFTVLAQSINGRDAQYAERNERPLERRTGARQNFRNRYLLAGSEVVREWGELRWTAASTVVDQKLLERYEAKLQPAVILPLVQAMPLPVIITVLDQRTNLRFASLESTLSRRRQDGEGWLVGISTMSNQLRQARDFGSLDSMVTLSEVENQVIDFAVFGEASRRVLRGVTLTFGGRVSRARLRGSTASDYSSITSLNAAAAELPVTLTPWRTQTSFVPSAAITTNVARLATAYLRFQKSYRPGGITLWGSDVTEFDADTLSAAEAGIRLNSSRVRGSAAIAYAKWNSVQVDTIDLLGLPLTTNAGDARIISVDLNARWQAAPALELEGAFLLNEGKIVRPEIGLEAFDRLPNVPRYGARLQLDHEASLPHGVSVETTVVGRYAGRSNLGIGPLFAREQGDWVDVSLKTALRRGKYSGHVAIDNLFNTVGNRFALGSPFTLNGTEQVTPFRPRSVRVGLTIVH